MCIINSPEWWQWCVLRVASDKGKQRNQGIVRELNNYDGNIGDIWEFNQCLENSGNLEICNFSKSKLSVLLYWTEHKKHRMAVNMPGYFPI